MAEPRLCESITVDLYVVTVIGPHQEEFYMRRNVSHKCTLTRRHASKDHQCECDHKWFSNE